MTVTGIIVSIIISLVANECCEVSPWAALRLVRWAARRRYDDPARADARAEELAALIEDRPGKLFKLLTACGFAIAAISFLTRRATARSKQGRHAYKERSNAAPSKDVPPDAARRRIPAFGISTRKVVLGVVAAASIAACAFVIGVLVHKGLAAASLWSGVVAALAGVVAAAAAVWAVMPRPSTPPLPSKLPVPDGGGRPTDGTDSNHEGNGRLTGGDCRDHDGAVRLLR